jgi:hypothetical protein
MSLVGGMRGGDSCSNPLGVVVALAFLVVILSVASESAVFRFSLELLREYRWQPGYSSLLRHIRGNISKKREEADSLATHGMTTRKARVTTKAI